MPRTAPSSFPARRRSLSIAFDRLEPRALLSTVTTGPTPSAPTAAVPLEVRPAHSRSTTRSRADRQQSDLPLNDIPYQTPTDADNESADSQLLDVYLPRRGDQPEGGWPVVLAIHGGGWRKFSKDQYGPKVAPTLTRQGFAVVAPNYVLSSRDNPSWPDCLDQLRDAVRWIRANAQLYGFDPTRIAAMGESAGGHLAAMLGTTATGDDTRIQAVVDFFGPADLTTLPAQSAAAWAAARQMLGRTAAADPAIVAAASPVDNVTPDDAPTLILQGSNDTLVPADQSRELASALDQAGVVNKLIVIPGAIHGFGFHARGRNLIPDILSFLSKSLHLKASADRA